MISAYQLLLQRVCHFQLQLIKKKKNTIYLNIYRLYIERMLTFIRGAYINLRKRCTGKSSLIIHKMMCNKPVVLPQRSSSSWQFIFVSPLDYYTMTVNYRYHDVASLLCIYKMSRVSEKTHIQVPICSWFLLHISKDMSPYISTSSWTTTPNFDTLGCQCVVVSLTTEWPSNNGFGYVLFIYL